MAHACNPSYSERKDQEDRGSKAAGQIVCRSYVEKPITKRKKKKKGLVEWLKV
jgi:hypothetical protein